MNINIKELFPVIHIDLQSQKAILNELARKIFKDKKEITDIISKINLKKKVEFSYVGHKLYVVNIISGVTNLYLLFSEIKDNKIAVNTFQTDNGTDIELYQKDVLKEFLEKFIALKKRYGGFNLKFLYLKMDFTLDLSDELKREYLHKILKYMLGITRSSDVVGQINENTFGIILTNATSEGANTVSDKILKYIVELNNEEERRLIEVYGALAHEVFIFKHTEFEEFVKRLDENSEFITFGMKLTELINLMNTSKRIIRN